ncbi:NAD(P)H-dependent FMN reductase [Nocardiopsis sp. Huas11]|uniref:NADPH-dependent FMN reductase n=1 Tax=Nocardiopsis sp. Huas11 TaxID=2183912 RepID=UPI000EB56B9D|nr:NAD(P)H-dependent oxidoreductase [Nocardiopsis sp. Huas11]RKS08599.1 NAD(P)H-dependent FMN reductase [Nocardiopsis sp. Huas11]
MDGTRPRVAIVIGGGGAPRFEAAVADWMTRLAHTATGLEAATIDLAAACLPVDPPPSGSQAPNADGVDGAADTRPCSVRDLAPWLAEADAFVVVTAEYHHGAPGPLKTAVDWFDAEWWAKPVGFCSYGERTGGAHATRQLREVFAGAHAVPVRDAVDLRSPDASLLPEAGPAAEGMLGQLDWWARALRLARDRCPRTF